MRKYKGRKEKEERVHQINSFGSNYQKHELVEHEK